MHGQLVFYVFLEESFFAFLVGEDLGEDFLGQVSGVYEVVQGVG